jgi:branched-chain amino acid transport system substrate-binding protein
MLKKQKDTVALVGALITTLIIAGGAYWALKLLFDESSVFLPPIVSSPSVTSIDSRISEGEKILVPEIGIIELIEQPYYREQFLAAKERGVSAISQGNFAQAIEDFSVALSEFEFRNDPETLIYLNNALIADKTNYTIAVAVPLGSQKIGEYRPNSLAILRGVAQAQQEINDEGGINGVPLKIIIVDDGNNKETASRLASILARKTEALGVIGHFSSGTTLAAKDIYDSEELPVISSTSTAVSLSEEDYIFRTVPSDAFTAKALARYMLESLGLTKAVIFFGSDDNQRTMSYSESLSSEFKLEVIQGGGTVEEFDLSGLEVTDEANRNSGQDRQIIRDYVEQAIETGVQCFMLAGYGGEGREGILDEIYEVIRANRGRVQLLGGDEMYDESIFKNTGGDGVDMVVAAAWNRGISPNSDFMRDANSLWGAPVNWFTAMSYDATQAFAEAIRRNPTRSGIQQTFSESSFSAKGSLEEIRFTPVGDRNGRVYLVKVLPTDTRSGYEFVPVR